MKKYLIKYVLWLYVGTIVLGSCKKQDAFLDEKPNDALIIATSLDDYRLLLNNETIFNSNSDPGLGSICGDDDYYVSNADWAAADVVQRNSYIWAPNFYEGERNYGDWTNPYRQVYYSNIVLDGLSKVQISPDQENNFNEIKGSALFFRSYAFYHLVQTFAPSYDSLTAENDLGICLRLTSDINVKSSRATVLQCYDQIIADLTNALTLLPDFPLYKTQPSKWAVNALLARINLAIRNYPKAHFYANACLTQNSVLTDYNTLNLSTFNISNTFLTEEIFHTSMVNYSLGTRTRAIIDSNLYNSYNANDLRKTLFFFLSAGKPYFRGTYDYRGNRFSGLATDEIFLIRAECFARLGNASAAMADLNTLLIKRWKNNSSWVPYTAATAAEALSTILNERRKELIFRGLRWSDLRRLNKENAFKKTLTRIINGTTYTLLPNDNKYVVPIPDVEIELSEIPQNPR